jgi:hypothetical protein
MVTLRPITTGGDAAVECGNCDGDGVGVGAVALRPVAIGRDDAGGDVVGDANDENEGAGVGVAVTLRPITTGADGGDEANDENEGATADGSVGLLPSTTAGVEEAARGEPSGVGVGVGGTDGGDDAVPRAATVQPPLGSEVTLGGGST